MRIGYLCSEFPAISHTFISREIDILEKDGFEIVTASINETKNIEKMGQADKERAKKTFYTKKTNKLKLLRKILEYKIRNLALFLNVYNYAMELSKKNGVKNFKKALGYFVQAILVDDWSKKNKINHIHVHFANPAATVAMIAEKFGNIKYSISVHGPDEFYNVKENNLEEKIRSAVFIRCISFYSRSQLMKLSRPENWKKLHIVRCGLYENEFKPLEKKGARENRILCVGRLTPSKGQIILLEAAKQIKENGIKFKLTLLGGGEDYEILKNKIKEYDISDVVELAGAVGHDRVKNELANTDIFVLPSFAEGIPVALMEAMAMKIPVVTTCITGIPELIENRIDGFLTEPSNVNQLADTITEILMKYDSFDELRNKAAEKVRIKYNVEKNTLELGKIFREYLK